jgi:hypothetical protein
MDNINSVGDFIMSVFSTLINKDDEIFRALLASNQKDSPGEVERIFNELEETRDKWCNTSNVYEQTGEMIEKSFSFFSVLTRMYDESDESFKERNKLLYIREGDTVWGDKWNIIRIFKKYFKTELVYIVNDTDDISKNILRDGDFEGQTGDWTLETCRYDNEAGFSERFGIKFDNYGTCSQNAAVVPDSTYFLHFFVRGNINVEIKDNNGRCWKPGNPRSDEFGTWVNGRCYIGLSNASAGWEPKSVYFLTDETTSGATISFKGIDGRVTHLDYVRLFKKESYSTFTLIAVFGGRYTPDTMAAAPGKEDPVTARNYAGYKHFSEGNHDADPPGYDRLSFFETAAVHGDDSLHDPSDYDRLSFFETAAINEDKDPVMAGGADDRGRITADNDKHPVMAGGADDVGKAAEPNNGYIEGTPLAPWKDDKPGVTVNYEKMSYIGQSHVFGAAGARQENIYRELLDIVKAGGIPSYIEILIRELDE